VQNWHGAYIELSNKVGILSTKNLLESIRKEQGYTPVMNRIQSISIQIIRGIPFVLGYISG